MYPVVAFDYIIGSGLAELDVVMETLVPQKLRRDSYVAPCWLVLVLSGFISSVSLIF